MTPAPVTDGSPLFARLAREHPAADRWGLAHASEFVAIGSPVGQKTNRATGHGTGRVDHKNKH